MASSIVNLKTGKGDKVSMIDVKVIQKIDDDSYIVADEKASIVFVSDQSLQEGVAYRLIKPSYENNKLRKNQKFAAVKLEKIIKTRVLQKEEIDKMCKSIENDEKKIVKNDENNFELVDGLGVGGIIDKIKLMVVTKSNIIEGKFGNYRIVTCKDIKNKKNVLNLYKDLHNMVDVEEIFVFTKLKISNFKKEEDEFHRIGTTYGSRIFKAGLDVLKDFKNAGVTLGDKATTGIIIGISELNIYESCKKCWCKVDAESVCRKCEKKVDDKKEDFNLIMYIQDDKHEDEVLDVFCFKSTLDLRGIEKMDVTEDNLNKIMMGKKCQLEYNINSDKDDKKLRLVKFLICG